MAQQASAKALKAMLYGLGERVVLGHSLVELLGRLTDRVPEMAARQEAAGVLDQYYVATRYPNGLPGGVPFQAFGETQARLAIDEATLFVDLAKTRVPVPDPSTKRGGADDGENAAGGGDPQAPKGS